MALLLMAVFSMAAQSAPCPFDANQTCTLQRDILNDKTSTGLKYYASTNYDHRKSGEINVYDATLVEAYQDNINAPGQIKFLLNKVNSGFYKSGEIMTRINLDQPPYDSPVKSAPWTTKEARHGYIEVRVKMPKCDASDDGLCQSNTNPDEYSNGLWPAIWMMPTNDAVWPTNGEIDIAEAYQKNTCFNLSTAALHFNGNDSRCSFSDCKGAGFRLGYGNILNPLYNDFHTWGFEWQPDPANNNGALITGYFDNIKVWGPLKSDSLPADGPNALSRGFNDPNGGYYLIVNLAIGGPYAGAPNPHLLTSSMYVQSIKAFAVNGDEPPPPPPGTCKPPVNIQNLVSPDKKQVTLSWQEPQDSSPVQHYEVRDWMDRPMWQGQDKDDRCFTDPTLPGTNGKFTYFLYTQCESGLSTGIQYDVNIQDLAKRLGFRSCHSKRKA